MASDNHDPPVFSVDPSSTPDILPLLTPLRASTRVVTQVNFTQRELSGVTLENDKLYVPTAANHPLFDSFTIDLHQGTIVISVFQATISPGYEESTKGYRDVREIVACVHKLLEEPGLGNLKVKVAYLLICPEDGCQHRWRMPIGWSENTKINDHRGFVYCLRVPISAPHVCRVHPLQFCDLAES